MPSWLQHIDTVVFLAVNKSLANRFMDHFFLVATEPVYYVLPLIAAFFLCLRVNRRKTLLLAALAVVTLIVSEALCTEVLKPFFDRPRPCHPEFTIAGARCIDGFKTSPSFPSAHAMNIFAQATLFTFLLPGKGIYFFSFAALIGVSRVYLGVHFPLDVVAGAIGGAAVGMGVCKAYQRLQNRSENTSA